jgi:ribose 5-phosphate isomerase A
MTIIERALEMLTNGTGIGLGSGRAARAFVKALAERVRTGQLQVYGVPTSKETESLAMERETAMKFPKP